MGRYSLTMFFTRLWQAKLQAGSRRKGEKAIQLNLCSKCKTGEYYYKLDQHSLYCPYIGACTQKGCPKFRAMDNHNAHIRTRFKRA